MSDANRLTDLVFFARHPERGGRALAAGEQGLIREWLDIRRFVVQPALVSATAPSPAQPAALSPTPSGGFRPVAVESPGGGRVQDKRDPAPSDVVTVDGVGRGRKVPLHRLAAAAWSALVAEARAAGIPEPVLRPTSGYRSGARQAQLFARAVKRYGSPEVARKWVAPPGGSAHQSGRAIDFYLGGRNDSSNTERLRQLPAYQWLAANAHRFGFYPYEREPWHWEYNPPSQPPGGGVPE